jgi:dTDP-4-dehydrorhamnose reductase
LENGGSELGRLPKQLEGAAVAAVDIEDANLADPARVFDLIRSHAPDAVINCAAYTAVDRAEEDFDTAFAANALAPRNLALACETAGIKLIHLSTDYIFDGRRERPYTEADMPAPATVYGSTKHLGERYVQSFCSRWFVVRTAWLYGRRGGNFVRTMLRLGAERDRITVVSDQRGNPTNAEDLAHHLLQLAPTEFYGIYHCTGQGVCSWYEFASEIMRLAGKKTQVTPCTTAEYAQTAPGQAPRPANSALEHAMLRQTVGDHMRPWRQALAAYINEFRQTGEGI